MTRRKRWEPSLTELQLDEIDKHPVERELSEVREIADWIVCTDRPEKETYAEVALWFARHGFCRKKGKVQLEVNIGHGLVRSWIALSLLWALFVLFTLLSPYGLRLQLGQKRETIALMARDGEVVCNPSAFVRQAMTISSRRTGQVLLL